MAQALPTAMAMQAKLMSLARSSSSAVFSLSNFDMQVIHPSLSIFCLPC